LHFVLISRPETNDLAVSDDEEEVNKTYNIEVIRQLELLAHGEKVNIVRIVPWESYTFWHGLVIKGPTKHLISIIRGQTDKHRLTKLIFKLARSSKLTRVDIRIKKGDRSED